jgi:orotidine-5'-phosphate decarboxylase
MLRSAQRKKNRIVLALDFSYPIDQRLSRAMQVLELTKGAVAAVKINHHLLLPFGLQGLQGLIEVCKSEELPIIADLKMNDIESTNLDIVDTLLAFGIDAVIANPFVGKEEGLGKVIGKVHSKDGGILFLVYMSHKGAKEGYDLRNEKGEPLYRIFASRARDWGADGVIVSAKEGDKITETRAIVGKDCLIFSPGIGPQGGDIRSGAASEADFLIVGRSITESPDPMGVLRELKASQRARKAV